MTTRKRRQRKPTVRAELAIIGSRLTRIEEEIAKQKIAADHSKQARSKWGDRSWDVFKTILASVLTVAILYGAGRLECMPPSPTSSKIEVRP